MKIIRSKCVFEIVNYRLNILQKLSKLTSWDQAKEFLHINGIRWFIVMPKENINWDAGFNSATFSSNGMALYDSGKAINMNFEKTQCLLTD